MEQSFDIKIEATRIITSSSTWVMFYYPNEDEEGEKRLEMLTSETKSGGSLLVVVFAL